MPETALGLCVALLAVFTALELGRRAGFSSSAERLLGGMLMLSCWTLFLGVFGLLSRASAALPLFVLPFSWMIHARKHALRIPTDEKPLLLVSILCLLWIFFGVLLPPSGMDALAYHLALPDQYLIRESIRPSLTGYSPFNQQFEMAIVPLLALDPSGIAVNISGFVIFLSLIAGGYAIGGTIGAAAIAVSPLLGNLVILTKNDILAAALCLWGYYRSGPRGAFFLGAAIAVKPTALLAVLPIVMMTWRQRSVRDYAALAVLPLFWGIRYLVFWGMQTPDVIGHAQTVDVILGSPRFFSLAAAQMRHFIESFFFHFPTPTDGPYGALMALLIFIFFKSAPTRVRLPAALGFLLWLLVGRGQARFALPLVALASSIGAAYVSKGKSLRALLLIIAIFTGVQQITILESENNFLALYSRRISLDDYFDPWLATYRLQKSADTILPRDAYVAVVGEGELFPLHRKADWDAYFEPSRFLLAAHESSPDELRTRLIEQGYTHLFYSPVMLQRLISLKLMVPPLSPNDITVLETMLEKCRPAVTDPVSGAVIYDLSGT